MATHDDNPELPDVQAADRPTLAAVAEVFDLIDPTPPAALDAAIAAFGFRDLDAQLAELVVDSWDPERSLALRAAPSDVRFLGFRRDGVSLDIELHPDGTLVGQIAADDEAPIDASSASGAGGGSWSAVQVESGAGDVRDLDVDDRGRFRDAVAARSIRLRCGARFVTPWISW